MVEHKPLQMPKAERGRSSALLGWGGGWGEAWDGVVGAVAVGVGVENSIGMRLEK